MIKKFFSLPPLRNCILTAAFSFLFGYIGVSIVEVVVIHNISVEIPPGGNGLPFDHFAYLNHKADFAYCMTTRDYNQKNFSSTWKERMDHWTIEMSKDFEKTYGYPPHQLQKEDPCACCGK